MTAAQPEFSDDIQPQSPPVLPTAEVKLESTVALKRDKRMVVFWAIIIIAAGTVACFFAMHYTCCSA